MGNKPGRNGSIDESFADKVLDKLRDLARKHALSEAEKEDLYNTLRKLKQVPSTAITQHKMKEAVELLNQVSLGYGAKVGKTPYIRTGDDCYEQLIENDDEPADMTTTLTPTKLSTETSSMDTKPKKDKKIEKEVEKLRTWLVGTVNKTKGDRQRHRLVEEDSVDYIPDEVLHPTPQTTPLSKSTDQIYLRSSTCSSGYSSRSSFQGSETLDLSPSTMSYGDCDRTVFEPIVFPTR